MKNYFSQPFFSSDFFKEPFFQTPFFMADERFHGLGKWAALHKPPTNPTANDPVAPAPKAKRAKTTK